MSITKPFTFQAGTAARANEVNENFDAIYSQVNTNIAGIANNMGDIADLELKKADINGSPSQRFAVANPVNGTDAVNKQTMLHNLSNIVGYIDGLIISTDNNSPKDTILVSPGSCYDNSREVVLALKQITKKQNTLQAANTTYYVYIIGDDAGKSIDIFIGNEPGDPTLPSGYTKYRLIGSYDTDDSKSIVNIKYYSDSNSSNLIGSYTKGKSGYRLYSDKYCIQWGTINSNGTANLLKEYNNTDYRILLGTNGAFFEGGGISGRTTKTFSHSNGKGWSYALDWMTIGYIK